MKGHIEAESGKIGNETNYLKIIANENGVYLTNFGDVVESTLKPISGSNYIQLGSNGLILKGSATALDSPSIIKDYETYISRGVISTKGSSRGSALASGIISLIGNSLIFSDQNNSPYASMYVNKSTEQFSIISDKRKPIYIPYGLDLRNSGIEGKFTSPGDFVNVDDNYWFFGKIKENGNKKYVCGVRLTIGNSESNYEYWWGIYFDGNTFAQEF